MSEQLNIPRPIGAFIDATNDHNSGEFLASLAETAIITDEGHDYRGIAAIKEWSDERYIGASVTLETVDVINADGKTVVTAKVDGNYDKTGLPNPLIMDFHFIVDGDKIAALNIRLPGE